MIARTAPAVLELLGDGVARTQKAIVAALAERHAKDDIVRTLMRLTVTGQVTEVDRRYSRSCRGVGGNWLRRRRFRLTRPRRNPRRDGSYVGRTRIASAFRRQRVVRPS
jgi:hypothetical protein